MTNRSYSCLTVCNGCSWKMNRKIDVIIIISTKSMIYISWIVYLLQLTNLLPYFTLAKWEVRENSLCVNMVRICVFSANMQHVTFLVICNLIFILINIWLSFINFFCNYFHDILMYFLSAQHKELQFAKRQQNEKM